MILDFGSLTRRVLLMDLERPEEIWVGQRADISGERGGGGRGGQGQRGAGRKQKDQRPACGERPKDSASSREIAMIVNALVYKA